MRRVIVIALLLLVTSLVLGATVFRAQVAAAAPAILNVFVTNGPGNPVPVHEQGTAAVRSANEEVSVRETFVNPSSFFCDGDLYTVPAAKQLVVEYVSAQAQATVDGRYGWAYVAVGGDTLFPLVLENQLQETGFFAASETIHFAVPAGTTLRFRSQFAGPPAPTFCRVDVSLGGYLQPAP